MLLKNSFSAEPRKLQNKAGKLEESIAIQKVLFVPEAISPEAGRDNFLMIALHMRFLRVRRINIEMKWMNRLNYKAEVNLRYSHLVWFGLFLLQPVEGQLDILKRRKWRIDQQ